MAAVACIGIAGCSDASRNESTTHLRGTITIDGEPLPADALGNIVFRPTAPGQGRTVGADIINGRYDCPDVPLGDVKAVISIHRPTGRMIEAESERLGGHPSREMASAIAPKYASGIDLEITGSDNRLDFDLEAAP